VILNLPVLALTPGDPAGVGPECALRLAAGHPELRLILVADFELLQKTCAELSIPGELHAWQPGEPVEAGRTACLPESLAVTARPGHPDPANARYVLDCLRRAVRMVRKGQAGALVTGPVHKGVINDAGIPFSGHTEFLAELGGAARAVMMLATDDLRVALVTTHLPLRDVPDAITKERVAATIRITHAELSQRFGVTDARLQVLGLNPHAGESGHLGHEDAGIIGVAIEECRADGIRIRGPVPADTAFTPAALEKCDAVIAMYHDQGLPVLKHAGFGRAVNVTLGLPFIRTSVDHGTALDIAGRGVADPSSFFQAASMAQSMSLESIRAHS
jgi:4-hydroxythreonine-4-phosphate dehydrogenase